MKRANWSSARFYGEHLATDDAGDLDVKSLRWLCGCGKHRSFRRSKAFPICRCGRRMRMLDHPRLGYARGAA